MFDSTFNSHKGIDNINTNHLKLNTIVQTDQLNASFQAQGTETETISFAPNVHTFSNIISQKFPKTRVGRGVQRPSETIDQLDQSKPTVTVPGTVSKSPLRKQPWRKKEEHEEVEDKGRKREKKLAKEE